MSVNGLKRVTLLLLSLSLTGVLVGCQSGISRTITKVNPISAEPSLVSKIRASGWLEKNCNEHPVKMSVQDYHDCIKVDAALLRPFDINKPHHFGKDYDPEKYYNCRLKLPRNYTDCDKYKLVRDEPAAVWPYPDVPPLKWPDAPEVETYQPGMSGKEYFQALCQKEAGEFIYKTVENVEGVYQIRPRYPERTLYMKDPYVMEDPSGFNFDESDLAGAKLIGNNPYFFYETSKEDPYKKKSLRNLENIFDLSIRNTMNLTKGNSHTSSLSRRRESINLISMDPRFRGDVVGELDNLDAYFFFRYFGSSKSLKGIKREQVASLKSKFGYIWRGVTRPKDREMGIAGGEVAIVDLKTNEVLALRRSFALTRLNADGSVWWLGALGCYGGSPDAFIKKVLIPKI